MATKEEVKSKAINRLKRVEGQIRGLRGMLEKGKACQDVLVQYAAVHAALTKVGYVIVNDAMLIVWSETSTRKRLDERPSPKRRSFS